MRGLKQIDWDYVLGIFAGDSFVNVDEVDLHSYANQEWYAERSLILEKLSDETKKFLRFLYSASLDELISRGRINKRKVKEVILYGVCRGNKKKYEIVVNELRHYVNVLL